MEFYFTDRQYNLLGIASTERGRFRIAGEVEAQSTTASTVALTGNVYFAKKDLNDAINMCVGEGGNYILYEDDRGVGHFMTIQNTQVDNTGCSINFQADDAGNDLKNEIVGTYTATKAMTFEQYFNLFCADSGWELGQNEIPSNVRTLEFTSEQTSYDRMLEVAKGFGVSIYFSFEINGLEPVHRYLNVVNKLGSTTNVTLRQGTDISQIVSETSTADLHTSIKAYGATPDGKTAPLNLVGYKWTDSTGQFVLGPDGVLRDTIAIRTWSRLRSNDNPDPESSHLQMVKTYDATTQATLLQSALADLKTYNHPAVNYTVTMARVPAEVSKGDTVYCEDEAQDLYFSATVLEVDKCYSIPTASTLTLGDFKIEHDQTSTRIKQVANQLKTLKQTAHWYPWTRYADNDQGAGISSLPLGKAYMAVVWGKTATPSDDPADYAGHWQKVTGADGADGVAGPKGADGKTPYFHTAYANDIAGTGLSQDPTNKSYIGIYSDYTQADSTAPSSYKWALFKGTDGADGVPGAKGADGRTSYFHTAWADDVSGQSGFTVSGGDGKKYIGTYSDFTLADSTNPADYNWALFKGEDGDVGPKGDQGLPGTNGSDGRTTYAHFAYANSQDGNTDFSTTDSNRKCIGFYSDFTSGDSTNPSDYNWSLIKGADGADGKDGVPGKPGADGRTPYFHIAYADSSDGNTNFSLDTPGSRKYIGSYTDFTQADSTNPASYSWQLVQGPKGDTGADGVAGKDGVGIKSTAVTYQASTSGTTAPTGTWVASPTAIAGQYQWTRTVWTYTDGTTETGYSVGHIGANGATGKDGIAGKDGVGITATAVTYQASTSGTTAPTGTWLTVPPTVAAGNFLWTRMIWTYTDGTTETGYSVAQMGKTGATGAQGATGPQGNTGPQGPQGPKGATGAQGPAGSDITSYASGLTLPSTVAPANSQFWLVDNNNVAIKFYKSTGSSWVEQQISASAINAATFNGLNFNGVTFTGSTFKSTFNNLSIDGYADTLTGEATLANGQLNILGSFSNQSGAGAGRLFMTSVTPSGWESYSTLADATPIDVASMNFGMLQLRQLISGNNTSKNAKYIQSDFKATDATTYERQVDLSDTANFSSAHIYYMRRGDQVTVTFRFILIRDTGWVGLSSIPVGYTPAHYIGLATPSISYQGESCTVYNNPDGWRLIPVSGQGRGQFQGSLSYVTYDGYPTDDAKTYIG